MLKMLQSPYRYIPAYISAERIDALIAQGAVAELQSSGRRGLNSVDLVTFTRADQILDQIQVRGHTAQTTKFVIEFNKAVRARSQAGS